METTVISQTQTTLHTAYVNKIEDLLFAKELHELRDNIVFNTKTKFDSKPVITATIIAVVNVLIIIYVYFDLKSTKIKKSS